MLRKGRRGESSHERKEVPVKFKEVVNNNEVAYGEMKYKRQYFILIRKKKKNYIRTGGGSIMYNELPFLV